MGVISPVAVDSNGNERSTGSMQNLGKDDFLQLLVAQMSHQDPLEPMKDEDFVAQLAQFSSVEQLANMNENQQQALDWDYLQMQTINNTMATSLIGKDVKAVYNTLYLDDTNLPQVTYSTTEYGKEIYVDITDKDGNLVKTLKVENVEPGSHSIEWSGRDEQGERLANGFYNMSIRGVDAAGNEFTPSTYLHGRVTGVIYRDGSAYLKVNGVEVALAEINSIDEAEEE